MLMQPNGQPHTVQIAPVALTGHMQAVSSHKPRGLTWNHKNSSSYSPREWRLAGWRQSCSAWSTAGRTGLTPLENRAQQLHCTASHDFTYLESFKSSGNRQNVNSRPRAEAGPHEHHRAAHRGGEEPVWEEKGPEQRAQLGREGVRRALDDSGLPPERLTRGGGAGDEEAGGFTEPLRHGRGRRRCAEPAPHAVAHAHSRQTESRAPRPLGGKAEGRRHDGLLLCSAFKPVGVSPSACTVMCSGRCAQLPFRRFRLSSSDFGLIFGFLYQFYIPPSSNLLGWNTECLHWSPYASDSMLRTKKQSVMSVYRLIFSTLPSGWDVGFPTFSQNAKFFI